MLVHGAWHDGTCWQAVASRLRRIGHEVYCPTLAGHGPDTDRTVSHQDCTDSLLRLFHEENLHDVILVGHSLGGTVIAKASESLHAHIRHLVFLNGFVLQDGQCLLDELTTAQRILILRLSGNAADGSVRLPEALWQRQFMNDAEPALAQRCYARLYPEPIRCLSDHLDLKRFHSLRFTTSFLHGEADQSLPSGPDRGWHPHMSSRLEGCQTISMPSGHEPFFTCPGLLARLLDRTATSVPQKG